MTTAAEPTVTTLGIDRRYWARLWRSPSDLSSSPAGGGRYDTSIRLVVQRGGPFDSPFEPAAIRRLTGIDIAQLVRYSGPAAAKLDIGAGSRYLAAAYTSTLASPLIYASGEEILPIGGFDGQTPAPSVATLSADVASGALHTVLLVPARDPRVAWVMGHCWFVPTVVPIIRTSYCGTPP